MIQPIKTKDNQTLPEEFSNFLRNNHSRDAYLENFNPEYDHLLFSIDPPESWLLFAFYWPNTPEGSTKWEKLHELWIKILHTNSSPNSFHRTNNDHKVDYLIAQYEDKKQE